MSDPDSWVLAYEALALVELRLWMQLVLGQNVPQLLLNTDGL